MTTPIRHHRLLPSGLYDTTLHLLLADDDKDDCFFFDMALEEIATKTSLIVVKDGETLMNYLTVQPGYLPDILFMDMHMPRIDGIECLRMIKEDPRLCTIPVVVHSTSTTDCDISAMYDLGAHYYMDKSSFSPYRIV